MASNHVFSPFSRLTLILVLIALVVPRANGEARAPSGVVNGVIGTSVLVLTGPWKFQPGDDPSWASPEFNDSDWASQDLTPPPDSFDPITGASGFVPGWTAQGFPHLAGYAWYRIHVKLKPQASSDSIPRLALTLPQNFDDAYQVYVNGQLIGDFGRFSARHVSFYNAQPRAFELPQDAAGSVITIAIRTWMDSSTPLISGDAGGLHGPPLLGETSAIDAMLLLEWDGVNRTQIGSAFSFLSLVVASILGFALYSFDRTEPAYLWLGAACTIGFLTRGVVLLGYYSMVIPMVPETMFIDVFATPLTLALWALFWASWFKLEDIRRIALIVWTLTIVIMVAMATVRPPLFGALVPVSASSWLVPVTLALRLLLGALLLWIAWRGMRKRTADGWMAVAPILLTIFWAYQEELTVIHVATVIRVWGLTITSGHIAIFLMLAIISILMMRRFVRSQRESVLLRLEIEQARQVQLVLIPNAIPSVPGFAVESEYRPAQEVGGDFFQILPMQNGGVLAVIGDVSGKGTPAAMTVSLLVGTVRTLAHYTQKPSEMLKAMNDRMIGRGQGGFTTCLVLRADPDGTVTLADAGHPAPYLHGQEIKVEIGFPLGLYAGPTYLDSTFRLDVGERLTMLTDGVVEARNETGELFGFDRTAAIAAQSAESIVRAAQEFGQEDDITVLTLARVKAA